MYLESIRLCSVQIALNPSLYANEESYYQELVRPLRSFKGEEDSLLVYPEDIGLFTLLFNKGYLLQGLSTLEEAIRRQIKRDMVKILWERIRRRVSFTRGLLLAHQKEMVASYVRTFSLLAREYRSFVVAGSIPMTTRSLSLFTSIEGRDRERLYNTSLLFDPQGEIIGWQKKVHLTELEGKKGLDLSPGSLEDLTSFHTPLGKMGIVICYDAFHHDVLKKMVKEDTEILVQPTANPRPWEEWQQEEWLLGMEMALREYPFIYGINSMLTGQLLDLPFAGQSTISANPSIKKRISPEPLGYLKTQEQETFLAVMEDPLYEGLLEIEVPHPSKVKR